MRRAIRFTLGCAGAALLMGAPARAAQETIRITCWKGYAEPQMIEAYKKLVQEKYKIDVAVVPHYPTDQDEFYTAAKDGTADLISPPADLAKTPRFNCFTEGNVLLQEIDPKNVPNAKHLLPIFAEDTSLTHQGKRYGVPYNCGPYGLAYNTEVVKQAPTSWKVFWDEQYKGKYTITNNFPKCNIWITALSLGYTYDQIFDIDQLDRKKIQQKLNVLGQNAKSLWDGEADPKALPELALATTWGFAAQAANLKGGKWRLAAAEEGGTAWIDYWCVTKAAKDQKKALCEEWINLMLSPPFQADVVKAQGVSPVVNDVGDLLSAEERSVFHAGDNEYFKTVAIWRVMSEQTEKAFGEMWEEAKKGRK